MSEHDQILGGQPYAGYSYAYPHKTAYRPFDMPLLLGNVWADEPRSALFLYVHIPFCRARCGFCNLFATTTTSEEQTDAYLAALERQAKAHAEAIGACSFSRLAIGGGTPSLLTPWQLDRLFNLLESALGVRPDSLPCSFELAPDTSTPERLQLLRQRGIERISVGVQSFDPGQSRALGRPQPPDDALRALHLVRQLGFPTLNIDLIYGGQGQTAQRWDETLALTLTFAPQEIYLYPLYVRPQTGLGRQPHDGPDGRQQAYRRARDQLLDAGYQQISMRLFRAGGTADCSGPRYCCQEDGMIGLGAGARSYTRALHYGCEYAVSRTATRALIDTYVNQSAESHGWVRHGFRLNPDERRRRYLIKSLLQCSGLDRPRYRELFLRDVLPCFPVLQRWGDQGLLRLSEQRVQLTDRGIELSDAIGPALYSSTVRRLMETYHGN